MYYYGKQLSGIYFIKKCSRTLVVFAGLLFLIAACSKDPEELKNNPPQHNNPQGQNQDSVTPQDSTGSQGNPLDPDVISEYLVLKDVSKITGELSTTVDGQIKMEIKDTIYAVKGYPLGNRIEFKHDPTQKVAGFHVSIANASYYYDVPKDIVADQYVPLEENDSISVLVLDLDLGTESVDYPFTTELIIQPHDPAGLPLDYFKRKITIEEPNSTANICDNITGDQTFWEWDYTLREYNGEILNVIAPGLATRINSQGAGCCRDDGVSVTTSDTPACYEGTTSPRLTWVQIFGLDDFLVRNFELLWLYGDGRAEVMGLESKKQYDRANTNFCTRLTAYTYNVETYGGYDNSVTNEDFSGTHDFTPGADHINFDFPDWIGGYRYRGSRDLIYTCNTLIFITDKDDKFSVVFKKKIHRNSNEPYEFYHSWKEWYE